MFDWLKFFLFPDRRPPAAPRAMARRNRVAPTYVLHPKRKEGVQGNVSCSATAIRADE